jgi:hypothetical protein
LPRGGCPLEKITGQGKIASGKSFCPSEISNARFGNPLEIFHAAQVH